MATAAEILEAEDDDLGVEELGDLELGPGGAERKTDDVDDVDDAYEAFDARQVLVNGFDLINNVSSLIQIPSTTVRLLLNHFKWDQEQLLERFYTESEDDRLFKEAAPASTPWPRPAKGECQICLQDEQALTGLECGHSFCASCWDVYLSAKIADEGACPIACPGECTILVDDEAVLDMVNDTSVKNAFRNLLVNSMVQHNRLLRWCPSPGCGLAVKASRASAQSVKCACSYSFCFACAEPRHDPVSCSLLKQWIVLRNDDSGTAAWIIVHVKQCPKCSFSFSKIGGCDHVFCISCSVDFCWRCLKAWEWRHHCLNDVVEVVRANKAGDSSSDEEDEAVKTPKDFAGHTEKFMSNLEAIRAESKLYNSVEEKMQGLSGMDWSEDLSFVKQAIAVLCESRRTLAFSYVFTFFLEKNNQREILEDLQKSLQSSTEALSDLLKRGITAEKSPRRVKQAAIDLFKFVDGRRKALKEHVEEGYDEGKWAFTEAANVD